MPSTPSLFRPCQPQCRGNEIEWLVWAPRAGSVTLILDSKSGERRLPMTPLEDGFHTVSSQGVEPGQRYGYSLDGGPTRPDPATLSQPDGVHHLSSLFFPGSYPWQSSCPSIEANELVLYEMHIGTFTPSGTFDAARKRLPDLVELGINAIEILPVAQFPGERNWGYDGVHPMATQHSYGGPASFQRFIDEAHRLGIAVILDVVFNHLGPEGNYLSEFAPYFTERHPTPWGPGFNFDDDDSQPLRDWFLECTWQWIHDFRLDGLRLDAVHAMIDESETHILTDIKQVADKAAEAREGKAIIIAESLLNDPVMITPVSEGGLGLDLEWNEDFHHAVSAWMTGETHGKYTDFEGIQTILKVMQNNFHLTGQHSDYYGKPWGKPADHVPADRFVVSLQNHDHIGNRAHGDRIASLVSRQQLILGACLTILGPFVPMLFMGEEYGETNPFVFFCSFSDSNVIRGVRRGRKSDYGLTGTVPDPQAPETYTKSILSWNWMDDHRSTLRKHYQDLIALRKSLPGWVDGKHRGDTSLIGEKGKEMLQIQRGSTSCYFNLSSTTQDIADGEIIWRSGKEEGPLSPFETILFRR
ncbi:MAG: malto-oligosyltrehalose trehalohydrolase [Verrucomicrobiales bacterium]|nr:malto-oligosyltrehalose trehalohydrolase [Verrucomicrobiales bacterium]